GRVPESTRAEVDDAVHAVHANRDAWVAVELDERIALIQKLRKATFAVADELVSQAIDAKGLVLGSPEEADEWTPGPYALLRNLRLLERSLKDIRRSGVPRIPGKPWTRPDGQVVAPVLPVDAGDKLLLGGYSAEIWMDPAVTLESLADTQAVIYQEKARKPQPGKVALVLGAGNVSSIGPMDVLYKIFVEDEVVVCKMNPVNDYVGRVMEDAFAPLIEGGFVRFVYGGVQVGKWLCEHPQVDTIHITGSDKTHDAIVFGVGPEGRRRKQARTPANTRHISSELGNVTPVIVVPGRWSKKDIDNQARNIVSGLTNNAGFNCIAHRVVVTHAEWPQRGELLDAIRSHLTQTSTRKAYYPGAGDRHASFKVEHPSSGHDYGNPAEGELPWTFITDVDAKQANDICFTTESFCGLFAETALSAPDAVSFVGDAVDFCNDTLWGTLSCSIIVAPDGSGDASVEQRVEQGIADLRYGNIVVNHIAALGYALVSPTWGAFPGHPVHDIRSGRGVVHNTLMFDRPQKSVIRGPFRPYPTPPWWVGHKRPVEVAKRITAYEASPSPLRLMKVAWSGMRG
ncbi:MAG: hypothetical protein ACI9MR_003825, partial [Myxococcota bacterium]